MSAAKNWLLQRLLAPVLRPVARLLIGLIAIPLIRTVRTKFTRTKEWDEEFEKDIDQWFRASLLLFFATKNVEVVLAEWTMVKFDFDLDRWYIAAGRILLAVGVVEAMPDQQLFSIIHPGPPRLVWKKDRGLFGNISDQAWPVFRGILCQHLNRSSPVLAIMAAIFDGAVGWTCYVIAIAQYLLIGLVTSRDKALDVLSEFDRHVALRRQELLEEFKIESAVPLESTSTCEDDSIVPPTDRSPNDDLSTRTGPPPE